MKIIEARNVNEAFYRGVKFLHRYGKIQDSRAGQVIVAPWPVTTVYEKPCERVLFSPARNANPFFHLFEALWMLAGRNDVAFLNRFVKNFGERFGEPDGTEHDAYGYRWRKQYGFDQLQEIINRLKTNPDDRQCVIQMWDARYDLTWEWKTRPCNTHIYLRLQHHSLEMTVCCRSNDIIWGAYGANAVHFSVLQEYLAAMIGIGVGRMYQISNNFHAYTDVLDKLELDSPDHRYYHNFSPSPLVENPVQFDDELNNLLDIIDGKKTSWENPSNKFLSHTALPMFEAHHLRSVNVASGIVAPDWKAACVEWLGRRAK